MNIEALKGQRILVVGLGVTGMSVVRYLLNNSIAFEAAVECDEQAASSYRRQLAELTGARQTQLLIDNFDAAVFSEYDLIVLSPGVPRSHPAIQAALENSVQVIGDIELFAGAVRKPVVAVTGSNGKSTVVAWLSFALQRAGINAVACGNIGQPALDALQTEAEFYILELSSYQLESTYALKAVSATVLNVSEDHLDRYDDIEHYASVKRRLLDMSEHVVLNYDDDRTWPVGEISAQHEYFSVSAKKLPEVRWHRSVHADSPWLCDHDCRLLATHELQLPGEHNVANALSVIALAAPLGIGFSQLQDGLLAYAGLPHRTQFVGEKNGVRWYNDSKGTNVDACRKAVLAMPGPVMLIAGGISKGADFTALAETLERCVKSLILLGQDREQMAHQMSVVSDIIMVDTLSEAVSVASDRASTGDVVLLSPACSSFDMFRNFEDRGNQFVTAVQEVLAA
ncbi:MAG: UDP-N-acetylmuramoyl-L-alanine--D-glutamate ligase [Granulosicoccus sp.]